MDVPCEHAAGGEFEAVLASHLGDPAVGVPLDGVDASLSGTDVTVDPTPAALKRAHTGVTPAAFAVADYGSVVLPSTPAGAELVSLYVERHVAVLDADRVVPGMAEAFERFGEQARDGELGSNVVATGPSATADMGDLVRGAHGPSDVRVVVVGAADEQGATDE
ncbi:LUD domain-containing protein [Halosimplex marinum]|uniref:LUD domain-containing protein n=1 Tax=Halosimplex marinum TaxID=3396620 RepID=UPI003F56A864